MNFRTEIPIQPLEQTIVYGDGLLFLGSCFADEVGGLCRELGFNAQVNPFGTLYNPYSVRNSILRLQSGQPFSRDDIIEVGEGYYCTFSHNTDFWCTSKEALINKVNAHLAEAHAHFVGAKWILVSLGTAWVYRDRSTKTVVSNCHKLPANRFERVFLDTQSIAELLSDLLRTFSDKQFVFTVSPLRHLKDGLHESQLSKASLLLAVNQVCESFPNAHYFPAYEILLDELRDYRFYKEDMIHPTDQAVRYIWERFTQFAINPSEIPAMAAARELRQMRQHKPMFPESEAYRRFEALKRQKEKELSERFPNVQM